MPERAKKTTTLMCNYNVHISFIVLRKLHIVYVKLCVRMAACVAVYGKAVGAAAADC